MENFSERVLMCKPFFRKNVFACNLQDDFSVWSRKILFWPSTSRRHDTTTGMTQPLITDALLSVIWHDKKSFPVDANLEQLGK